MHGELSFFELGVRDPDRAREFYGSLFGWEFVDEGNGATIETPNVPGGLHRGDAGASPYLFFRVDDLDSALARGCCAHASQHDRWELVSGTRTRWGRDR